MPVDGVGDSRQEQKAYRQANELKQYNRRLKQTCKETIKKIQAHGSKCLSLLEEVKNLKLTKPAENEFLQQKTNELQQNETNLKNLRRQVDLLKKTYKSESYTELISLINKNKAGALRL